MGKSMQIMKTGNKTLFPPGYKRVFFNQSPLMPKEFVIDKKENGLNPLQTFTRHPRLVALGLTLFSVFLTGCGQYVEKARVALEKVIHPQKKQAIQENRRPIDFIRGLTQRIHYGKLKGAIAYLGYRDAIGRSGEMIYPYAEALAIQALLADGGEKNLARAEEVWEALARILNANGTIGYRYHGQIGKDEEMDELKEGYSQPFRIENGTQAELLIAAVKYLQATEKYAQQKGYKEIRAKVLRMAKGWANFLLSCQRPDGLIDSGRGWAWNETTGSKEGNEKGPITEYSARAVMGLSLFADHLGPNGAKYNKAAERLGLAMIKKLLFINYACPQEMYFWRGLGDIKLGKAYLSSDSNLFGAMVLLKFGREELAQKILDMVREGVKERFSEIKTSKTNDQWREALELVGRVKEGASVEEVNKARKKAEEDAKGKNVIDLLNKEYAQKTRFVIDKDKGWFVPYRGEITGVTYSNGEDVNWDALKFDYPEGRMLKAYLCILLGHLEEAKTDYEAIKKYLKYGGIFHANKEIDNNFTTDNELAGTSMFVILEKALQAGNAFTEGKENPQKAKEFLAKYYGLDKKFKSKISLPQRFRLERRKVGTISAEDAAILDDIEKGEEESRKEEAEGKAKAYAKKECRVNGRLIASPRANYVSIDQVAGSFKDKKGEVIHLKWGDWGNRANEENDAVTQFIRSLGALVTIVDVVGFDKVGDWNFIYSYLEKKAKSLGGIPDELKKVRKALRTDRKYAYIDRVANELVLECQRKGIEKYRHLLTLLRSKEMELKRKDLAGETVRDRIKKVRERIRVFENGLKLLQKDYESRDEDLGIAWIGEGTLYEIEEVMNNDLIYKAFKWEEHDIPWLKDLADLIYVGPYDVLSEGRIWLALNDPRFVNAREIIASHRPVFENGRSQAMYAISTMLRVWGRYRYNNIVKDMEVYVNHDGYFVFAYSKAAEALVSRFQLDYAEEIEIAALKIAYEQTIGRQRYAQGAARDTTPPAEFLAFVGIKEFAGKTKGNKEITYQIPQYDFSVLKQIVMSDSKARARYQELKSAWGTLGGDVLKVLDSVASGIKLTFKYETKIEKGEIESFDYWDYFGANDFYAEAPFGVWDKKIVWGEVKKEVYEDGVVQERIIKKGSKGDGVRMYRSLLINFFTLLGKEDSVRSLRKEEKLIGDFAIKRLGNGELSAFYRAHVRFMKLLPFLQQKLGPLSKLPKKIFIGLEILAMEAAFEVTPYSSKHWEGDINKYVEMREKSFERDVVNVEIRKILESAFDDLKKNDDIISRTKSGNFWTRLNAHLDLFALKMMNAIKNFDGRPTFTTAAWEKTYGLESLLKLDLKELKNEGIIVEGMYDYLPIPAIIELGEKLNKLPGFTNALPAGKDLPKITAEECKLAQARVQASIKIINAYLRDKNGRFEEILQKNDVSLTDLYILEQVKGDVYDPTVLLRAAEVLYKMKDDKGNPFFNKQMLGQLRELAQRVEKVKAFNAKVREIVIKVRMVEFGSISPEKVNSFIDPEIIHAVDRQIGQGSWLERLIFKVEGKRGLIVVFAGLLGLLALWGMLKNRRRRQILREWWDRRRR